MSKSKFPRICNSSIIPYIYTYIYIYIYNIYIYVYIHTTYAELMLNLGKNLQHRLKTFFTNGLNEREESCL